jgi:TonB family protein
MRSIVTLLLVASAAMAQSSGDWQSWLNRGIRAFKSGQYPEAVADFQKAADQNPSNPTVLLYLATAYMQQYIPGADSQENRDVWQKADAAFQRVLTIDPNNQVALASLASLNLNAKKWDDARTCYRQLLLVDPGHADPYYSLAFIDWSQWYPAFAMARTKLAMNPADPGPIPDPAVRTNLRSQWWSVLEDGIWNLNRALEINPQYDDAMAYMNLFIRERADLRDTKQEYQQDVRSADEWVQKALQTKKARAESASMGRAVPPPPPPPTPPPPGSPQAAVAPQRIRVAGSVEQDRLISQAKPVYPLLAQQARIQGVVRLSAVIGKDGRIQMLQVLSGHPLLVAAALEAVTQWVYRPTLLNEEPVEVATEIDVNFALPDAGVIPQ